MIQSFRVGSSYFFLVCFMIILIYSSQTIGYLFLSFIFGYRQGLKYQVFPGVISAHASILSNTCKTGTQKSIPEARWFYPVIRPPVLPWMATTPLCARSKGSRGYIAPWFKHDSFEHPQSQHDRVVKNKQNPILPIIRPGWG